jgi:hypothetical protein
MGVIGVRRTGGWSFSQIFETLILMDDRAIVVRTAEGGAFGWGAGNAISAWHKSGEQEKQLAEVSPQEILRSNVNNYEIAYSSVKNVQLKKFGLGVSIRIVTDEKEYKWSARGIPGKKNWKIEDFENILQPIFADRLSVMK